MLAIVSGSYDRTRLLTAWTERIATDSVVCVIDSGDSCEIHYSSFGGTVRT